MLRVRRKLYWPREEPVLRMGVSFFWPVVHFQLLGIL